MADDEQFSLCWNNFNTNLSAGFHESLCRGDLVDVSLAAEGQIVKAHRLVLSVCSPFFRKMFTQMPPNAHAFVFLNNVSHSALKDLIQFMYCGEVNVKQDALPAFISTAESLQIKGLTDNDPAPQPPQEPTPPPPAAPHVQQQQQQVPTQRVQRQQPRASARYKIETVDDVLGDDKGTTQIVIQTTTAPQATIVQQQQQQQQQQQTQHIQTQQQLQTGTTTTATLVSTNKRTAQRGSLVGSGNVKRSKTTTTTANVIDPLDTTPDTATTTTTAQQLASQQITVQTTVVPSETKVHQVRQQQAAAQEEAEYIDLPMELPTKSEPDYSEDHAEVAGDGDTTYVEDDTYGDMRYDDSYFTENEDAGAQTAGGNTSAANVSATTSKAVVKQQSQSYSDSSFVDTGADQGNTEAQVVLANDEVPNPEDVLVFFTQSLRGRPAIMANGIRFLIMSENKKKILWRCSSMATKKLKCPARITMLKENPPKFIINKAEHMHAELKRNKYSSSKAQTMTQAQDAAQIKLEREMEGAVSFELHQEEVQELHELTDDAL
ncbi:modifier of mdg4-like isoform X5 [Drosophila sulfurigaster albostrigata]|uniref:modifier of mdg4-like isoform X5 n=1 Tax=Drosophila sulfurigaster albostrigata TaxID=89887 RepID=UPI002D21ED65|nr:modifier of mdg4-like isoform X5 [Drosophila sulfurigaster albostrigata]